MRVSEIFAVATVSTTTSETTNRRSLQNNSGRKDKLSKTKEASRIKEWEVQPQALSLVANVGNYFDFVNHTFF